MRAQQIANTASLKNTKRSLLKPRNCCLSVLFDFITITLFLTHDTFITNFCGPEPLVVNSDEIKKI
jgi:hypothetical protein